MPDRIGASWLSLLRRTSPDGTFLSTRGTSSATPVSPFAIRHLASGGAYVWEFSEDDQDLRVKVDGPMTFNSSSRQVEAALARYGIAYVPEDLATVPMAKGGLTIVLDDWSPTFPGYYLYYPSRRQNLPAFKVVVEALRHPRD